jgi:hypothetical protein
MESTYLLYKATRNPAYLQASRFALLSQSWFDPLRLAFLRLSRPLLRAVVRAADAGSSIMRFIAPTLCVQALRDRSLGLPNSCCMPCCPVCPPRSCSQMGEQIYHSLQNITRVPHGYASVHNVGTHEVRCWTQSGSTSCLVLFRCGLIVASLATSTDSFGGVQLEDHMTSFFLAETCK